MNVWKISTLALVVGITWIGGTNLMNNANAMPAEKQDAMRWDWGVEQPHMEKALGDLRGARHSLELAAENKGGWRVLALRHTDEAIAETTRGIEYGRNHPHE